MTNMYKKNSRHQDCVGTSYYYVTPIRNTYEKSTMKIPNTKSIKKVARTS